MEKKVQEGSLYKERTAGVKFPRIIRVKKIEKIGTADYVYFMAQNQAAQIIHPNGGFIPLDSFLTAWAPND